MIPSMSWMLLLVLIYIPSLTAFVPAPRYNPGQVLILDHLNINHEKGRHDLLRAFYYDLLGLAPDPRKEENMEKGKKTLWANAGITQFHLPEAEKSQVLDGVITLAYPTITPNLEERLSNPPEVLRGTHFHWEKQEPQHGASGDGDVVFAVTDPWGTQFRLIADEGARDVRGVQPGPESLPCSISDICVYVPRGRSLQGISRFYDHVLGAPSLQGEEEGAVSIVVSPQQTLTFKHAPSAAAAGKGVKPTPHEDLVRDDEGKIIANHGPHVSMYITDLPGAYRRAADLGVTFVNTRFKRKAYTLDEAVEQCMFRCLDIVDPQDVEAGPIIRLEHEIRSMTNADGSKYKSCPFTSVPP